MTATVALRELHSACEEPALHGGLPEVFVLPGLGGDARELKELRDGCATTLHCIPIDFPDWTEIHAHAIALDAFVDLCVERIRCRTSGGPLRLAGYSFGGVIAFAVAARLAASGHVVAKLGLLDSAARPGVVDSQLSAAGRRKRMSDAIRRGELYAELGRLIAGLLVRSRSPHLLGAASRARYVKLPMNMHEHIAEPLQTRFRLPILKELADRMALSDVSSDIPTVLFRCDRHDEEATPDLGWGRYLRHLRIVPVSGDHSAFMHAAEVPGLCGSFATEMSAPPAPG